MQVLENVAAWRFSSSGNLRQKKSFGELRWSMKFPDREERCFYLQQQMGHSSIQTTVDIYGHLLKTRKPEEAAKTDSLLFSESASK